MHVYEIVLNLIFMEIYGEKIDKYLYLLLYINYLQNFILNHNVLMHRFFFFFFFFFWGGGGGGGGGGSKTVNLHAYLKSHNFLKWMPTPNFLRQYDDSNVLHNLLTFQKVVNVRN